MASVNIPITEENDDLGSWISMNVKILMNAVNWIIE